MSTDEWFDCLSCGWQKHVVTYGDGRKEIEEHAKVTREAILDTFHMRECFCTGACNKPGGTCPVGVRVSSLMAQSYPDMVADVLRHWQDSPFPNAAERARRQSVTIDDFLKAVVERKQP